MQNLQQLYDDCCHGEALPSLSGEGSGGEVPWVDELIKIIYKNKQLPDYKAAAEWYYEKFWSGVSDGFGDFDGYGEDFDMLASLQRNVVQFSNAKSYQVQRQMLDGLIDGNGKLRTYGDFKQVAQSIAGDFNNQHLRAEYDLSIASAQMASKWNKAVKNSDTLPLMQFDAVMDNRTTHLCRDLDGIILPIDHWFWKEYYPPNHWNCRSTVRSLATGKISDLSKYHLPELKREFQTNLAQNGLVYPKGHPYFNGYDGSRDKALMQKEVKKNAIEKYEGMSVDVDGLGSVKITKPGIKKGVSTYANGEDAFREISLNNILSNLLENSKYMPHLDRIDGIEKYYYLSMPNISGINITIKETPAAGKIYYGFSLKK